MKPRRTNLPVPLLPQQQLFASHLGPAEVTAWAILGSIWEVFYSVTAGIGDAAEIRVALHLGDNHPTMARLSAYKSLLLGMVVSSGVSVLYFYLQDRIPAWFTSDETLQAMLAELVPFVGVANLTMSFGMQCWSLIGAQGKYKLATWITFFSSWGVSMPLAAVYVYVFRIDLQGLASAVAIGYLTTGASLSYVLLSTDWYRVARKIQRQNAAEETEEEESEDQEEEALYASLKATKGATAKKASAHRNIRNNIRLLTLPAGTRSGVKLGKIDNRPGSYVVKVNHWSPLNGVIKPGDSVLFINGHSVSDQTAKYITKHLNKAQPFDRELVVNSPPGEEDDLDDIPFIDDDESVGSEGSAVYADPYAAVGTYHVMAGEAVAEAPTETRAEPGTVYAEPTGAYHVMAGETVTEAPTETGAEPGNVYAEPTGAYHVMAGEAVAEAPTETGAEPRNSYFDGAYHDMTERALAQADHAEASAAPENVYTDSYAAGGAYHVMAGETIAEAPAETRAEPRNVYFDPTGAYHVMTEEDLAQADHADAGAAPENVYADPYAAADAYHAMMEEAAAQADHAEVGTKLGSSGAYYGMMDEVAAQSDDAEPGNVYADSLAADVAYRAMTEEAVAEAHLDAWGEVDVVGASVGAYSDEAYIVVPEEAVTEAGADVDTEPGAADGPYTGLLIETVSEGNGSVG